MLAEHEWQTTRSVCRRKSRYPSNRKFVDLHIWFWSSDEERSLRLSL